MPSRSGNGREQSRASRAAAALSPNRMELRTPANCTSLWRHTRVSTTLCGKGGVGGVRWGRLRAMTSGRKRCRLGAAAYTARPPARQPTAACQTAKSPLPPQHQPARPLADWPTGPQTHTGPRPTALAPAPAPAGAPGLAALFGLPITSSFRGSPGLRRAPTCTNCITKPTTTTCEPLLAAQPVAWPVPGPASLPLPVLLRAGSAAAGEPCSATEQTAAGCCCKPCLHLGSPNPPQVWQRVPGRLRAVAVAAGQAAQVGWRRPLAGADGVRRRRRREVQTPSSASGTPPHPSTPCTQFITHRWPPIGARW